MRLLSIAAMAFLPIAASLDSAAADLLLERTAVRDVVLNEPQDIHQIMRAIQKAFGVTFSTEPLPESCVGSSLSAFIPPRFEIVAGETFESVMHRFEAITQGRWLFEEIHGVPLLRPDNKLEGHENLLDTIITLEIKANSMWEALCTLALAVNEANDVRHSNTRPLLIMFLGPSILKHPPEAFIQEMSISISLNKAPAREGFCAILEQTSDQIYYFYTCMEQGPRPLYDYIAVNLLDGAGRIINGPRFEENDFQELLETKAWMSTDGLMKAQVPTPKQAE